MCLGDCYELKKPSSRDANRAWYHYEYAITKYPQQITLDIMLRVIHNSLSVLIELGTPNRAAELCARVIDTTFKPQSKDDQHDNTAYLIFDHVRMTYLCAKNKETDKVLFHATQALTLYKQQGKNGSIMKASNNDDLKTILKWISEICIGEKAYDTALIHLYEITDVLADENEETSYDYRRHPSFRVSVNSMIGSVFQERNKGEWRQALTHYHAALHNLRLIISSASITEGRLHFFISGIWKDQSDAEILFGAHMQIASMVLDLNTNSVIYPPVHILMASSKRAEQYETLAGCYDSQLAFTKLGIVAKVRAIDYASMATRLLKNTSEHLDHIARLQSFIDKIKQKYDLQIHSSAQH